MGYRDNSLLLRRVCASPTFKSLVSFGTDASLKTSAVSTCGAHDMWIPKPVKVLALSLPTREADRATWIFNSYRRKLWKSTKVVEFALRCQPLVSVLHIMLLFSFLLIGYAGSLIRYSHLVSLDY